MIIKQAFAKNFGSYAELNFDFSVLGLHLISGPTGAGKSTICDLIPWTLFGKTSKNGLADEIRRWGANEDTEGSIRIEKGADVVTVVRKRGKNNDLYYIPSEGGNPTRGKDIKDTQRMLEYYLGFDADQYLVSSYYNELSSSAQFFTTTAKNRRQITEQLIDLRTVTKVQSDLGEEIKFVKTQIEQVKNKRNFAEAGLLTAEQQIRRTTQQASQWQATYDSKIADLETKALNFDSELEAKFEQINNKAERWDANSREIIAQLTITTTHRREESRKLKTVWAQLELRCDDLKHAALCNSCGNPVNSKELNNAQTELILATSMLQDVQIQLERELSSLETQKTIVNPFKEELSKIQNTANFHLVHLQRALEESSNPHQSTIKEHNEALDTFKDNLKTFVDELLFIEADAGLLEAAKEAASVVRRMLIEASMHGVENETNRILESHFDAELRIEFLAENHDNLDVMITKDGNICSYAQLSKGQRQLLKLSFAVACMKTAYKQNANSSKHLFFDEALDGLDDVLKVKSFSLLEELASAYDGVYVVEHNSELKNMFTSRFDVSASNGFSEIRKSV